MIRFGILDHDSRYAQRLVEFFSVRFDNQTEPYLFHNAGTLLEYLERGRLDLVLASIELLPDPEAVPGSVPVFYLSEDPELELIKGRRTVFRYQRGEALLRCLKGLAAEQDSRSVTFSSSGKGRIFTFAGASGGAGCTTAAVGCAAAFAAAGKKALYLCLQNNGYVGDCLPRGGNGSMFRVLYEVKMFLGDRERRGNLTSVLEGMLKYDAQLGIYYYDASPQPLEAASMKEEELELILTSAAGLFDVVAADMDGVFSPLLQTAARLSDRVILVGDGSAGGNFRLNQLAGAFAMLDERDSLRLLPKCRVLYNRFGSAAAKAELSWRIPVLGTVERFSGADTRAIVAELAKRTLYSPLLDGEVEAP